MGGGWDDIPASSSSSSAAKLSFVNLYLYSLRRKGALGCGPRNHIIVIFSIHLFSFFFSVFVPIARSLARTRSPHWFCLVRLAQLMRDMQVRLKKTFGKFLLAINLCWTGFRGFEASTNTCVSSGHLYQTVARDVGIREEE